MELKRYLRVVASTGDDGDDYSMVEISNRRAREAADRIEKLEAENAELQSKVGTIRLAAKYAAKIRDDRIEKLEEQLHYANGVADTNIAGRLYAENRIEKLQAALRKIDQTSDNFTSMSYAMFTQTVRNIARKALEGKDDTD